MDIPTPKKADPQRSVLDFIAADNVDEESSEDDELEEQAEAMMGIAQAPTEAIDWDALLLTEQPNAGASGLPKTSCRDTSCHESAKLLSRSHVAQNIQ